ncbi:MAG: fimbrillin family protein [Rikenellaceae bacterium]|nr:fimbrillin family protein [Rikenellaceae bacterium]
MKTMKYLVPALMLFAGVACTKEIAAPEQDNVQEEATEQLELSASLSNVRTSLSGVKTLWSKDDEIAVRKIWQEGSTSRTSSWYKFTVKDLTNDSASATFTGNIATGENYTLEAVYPYESALASEAGAINLSIPSEQDAKAGSFGEKAAVAVGVSSDDNVNALTFSNVGSAMKFKLVHDASSVVITSTSDGVPVAGQFSYSEGQLTILSDNAVSSSVTVSGEMKAGETYYAIVAPGTYNISAAISGVEVKKSSAEPGIKFEANMINNLGIIADVNQIPNCYIVKPGETVKIPVYKAFAMWEESAWSDYKPSEKNPGATVVQVLWEDVQGLLTNIDSNNQLPVSGEGKLNERFFTVTANNDGKTGNAAVSIRFGGEFRWTIHIWVTDYAGESYQASNGLEFMDRNLGATSTKVTEPASYGVYYQGVRYNPFPGPNAEGAMKSLSVKGVTKSITYTPCWGASQEGMCRWISKNPTVFVTASDQPYSWLTKNNNDSDYVADFWPSKTNSKKTAYDPCPAGWMLPVADAYSFWDSATDDEDLKKYPAAGRLKFDFTYSEVGSSAVLWCGDPTGLKTCSAYINFNTDGSIKEHNVGANHSRANALPVRCVKIK